MLTIFFFLRIWFHLDQVFEGLGPRELSGTGKFLRPMIHLNSAVRLVMWEISVHLVQKYYGRERKCFEDFHRFEEPSVR